MKISKTPRGYWQTTIYFGKDPLTGKKIQKVLSAKTKSECRAKALAILDNRDEVMSDRPDMVFPDFCSMWLSEYTTGFAPGTLKAYRGHVNNYINPFFSKIRLSQVTPVLCQRFINSLTDLSPKSVRNLSGTLHKILATAVRIGYLKSNPAEKLELPKRVKPELHPLEPEEVDDFLIRAKDDPFCDLFELDLLTGLRISEILALTWDRIDSGRITVDRQLPDNGTLEFRPTKNRKGRIVPIGKRGMEILTNRRVRQLQEKLKAGPLWSNPEDLVFTNAGGGRLSQRTISKHFNRYAPQDVRFHDLRHTFAVTALKAGVDIKTVSETLGHYSAAFTLDVYAFVSERMLDEAAEKIDKIHRSH